jgi:hypothetical protein
VLTSGGGTSGVLSGGGDRGLGEPYTHHGELRGRLGRLPGEHDESDTSGE